MAFTIKKRLREESWDEKWWRDSIFAWKWKQTATLQIQDTENPEAGSYQIKQALGKREATDYEHEL